MKLRKEDPFSLTALVGANLIPIIGIFLFDWDVRFIVLLYWYENLIVGCYNILKMTILRTKHAADNVGKLFTIPFFCIHYGGFCAVHGFFLMHFFHIGTGSSPFDKIGNWWGPLIFIQLLFSVVAKIWASRPPEMIWVVIGLTISHGVSFVENYLIGGEYKTIGLKTLMYRPYQRIVVMHIAILFGGIFILQLHSPLPLLLILVLVKISFDLHLHGKSHRGERMKKARNENNGRRVRSGNST